MAYQSLNIIGSFTAGTAAVQRDAGADRDRVEAYRSLLRSQVLRRGRTSEDDVDNVESPDRMVIGDAPHDRRNPYLFLRYPGPETAGASQAEGEGDEHLDVVV